jgi:methyl coenzyme M reductase beta subunit
VKREAMLDRRTVGAAVGELVVRSVQDRVIPRRRPHQSSAQRFARLFVDAETWGQFRALALDAHVSAGRLVGLLVEREARRFEDEDR